MSELLHGDECLFCRRVRRQRRGRIVRSLFPWFAVLGFVLTLGFAEWALR